MRIHQTEISEQLIADCKSGDHRAQLKLYNQYAQAMFNTARTVLNNDADAEECMQEAFLRAFKSLHQYRAEASFGAWLKRITINECLRRQRRVRLEFESISSNLKHEEEEPDRDFPFSISQVKQAMSKLPVGYKVVLQLYLIEGYDHEEIAQILDMKSATSRSQYLRGKKKLAEILKSSDYE